MISKKPASVLNFILCAFALALCSRAWAIIPENGWWSVQNKQGSFNLEVQNNLLFLSTYGYDSSGNGVWYFAGDTMTSDHNFSSTLYRAQGGACTGCAYVAPQIIPVGTVTITFTSSQTGNISLNGVSMPITRFDFWLNNTQPDALLGEWSLVIGSPATSYGVYWGDRVSFWQKSATNSLALLGSRSGASSRPASVLYDPSLKLWAMLIDSSSSYYDYYEFNTTGYNRVEGWSWTFVKSASPTGSGLFFLGHRTMSYNYLIKGSGPAASQDLPAEDGDPAEKAAAERAKKMSGEAMPEQSRARFEQALKLLAGDR